jgi:bacterioferritin-associated ferredoxin
MSDEGTEPTSAASSFVCRCEEIGEAEIRQAIADGALSVNDVKRRTRAGMGICQGIYCVRPIVGLLHRLSGAPLEEIVPMTARPPVRLLPLELLAEMEE